tara:strand:+ start:276 stop:494 length:219 start_codon:yes stop_codon:yes gene_type:complete
MFSIEPFSTLPMSDDGADSRTASSVAVVFFMNDKTLTFPLKINRLAEFDLNINKALELSLNRNTVLDFEVRR